MKQVKWPLWVFAVLVAVGLASCGPTAFIEKNPNISITDYKTFGWAEQTDKKQTLSLTEQQVRAAAERELANAGYRLSKNPDVLLSYDVLSERTETQQSEPVYSQSFMRTFYNPYARRFFRVYYPSQFMGYDNYTVAGNEGTVTITMTDARNGNTILQGWATDDIRSRKMTSAEADKIVKAIFKKLNTEVAKK